MQIPVVVERVKGNGYSARSAEPIAVTARGPTRDEALSRLREKIAARLQKGTELVGLEVGPQVNPWLKAAGMFKDDPWIEDWIESMAEYRRQVENDPNR
jgi:hypothetical protein